MVMTTEQKAAKESAEKFIIYLYKKYYTQVEAEMDKRAEMQESISVNFFQIAYSNIFLLVL